MAIDVTYRQILIEEYIAAKLKAGIIPSAEEIETQIALYDEEDLSKPLFDPETYHTVPKEEASASKFNNGFASIRSDIRALYKEMLLLSKTSSEAYERWGLESNVLEKRLIDLQSRIENLLLITQDTDGYKTFIVDNFSDATLVDLTNTTADLDLNGQQIIMGPNSLEGSRIFLNNLASSDVSFRIRTTIDLLSRNDSLDADLRNPFNQVNQTWWTVLQMRTAKPVTCELSIKLGDTPVKLTRIFIEIHDSTKSSPMVITPLYSNDNYNFSQLPTNTYTQEVRSVANFNFSEIEAKYMKFILTKAGPDLGNTDAIDYQFGFKQINFYGEAFGSDTVQQFFSKPLSVEGTDGNPVPFSKLTLETCERVETNTNINYFVAASNNPQFPVDPGTEWFPITPKNRAIQYTQAVLDLGDVQDEEFGISEIINVSYNGTSTNASYLNPAQSFHLLSNIGGVVFDETVNATDIRYTFINKGDRILNYQIKQSNYVGSGAGNKVELDQEGITIFRNVGSQGLIDTESSDQVRGIQKGWTFQEPYYSTVVEILNPNGFSMDVGNSPIIVDDVKYTNNVPSSALSGKSPTSDGIHTIKVHKDNWLSVEPDLNTLAELQAADTLYPFNHKLLVEGYRYGSLYPSSDTKAYIGVDLFAEILMKKVSIFDLVNNLKPNDYKYFALDNDAPMTHTGGNLSTMVFVIKTDDSNPDFQNERFVIRFTLINQRYTYLRLRADLSTEDEKITPSIDSYKIKLA